jgi:hypothetical protein
MRYSRAGSLFPDNPKRVWSIDQIGKAVYQRELNERFMSVVA